MRHLLVPAALFFVLGCASARPLSATDRPRVGAAGATDRTCSRDSECVLVDDCCGCSYGGQRLAIRSDRFDALAAEAETACGTRHCAPAQSSHHSCTATAARCLGGLCVPAI
jgi:hypothetical protein